jgi:hypothetical protein
MMAGRAASRTRLFLPEKELRGWRQPSKTRPHRTRPRSLGVPAFFVSSFNLSATSNEVVLVGNELFPTWSGEGAAQPPVLRPRLVIRLSPQSAKDLSDVLQNFVANFERAYGELRTDYLLRKQTGV